MIFNLSHPLQRSVYDNIMNHCGLVHYSSFQDEGQWTLTKYCEGNSWIAKADLADAYRIVSIKRSDRKFLGIYVEEQYYIDRMQTMGASRSCQIFNSISDGLLGLFNYLDDFLFIAHSQEHCEQALKGNSQWIWLYFGDAFPQLIDS